MLVYDRLEEVVDDEEGSQAEDDDKDPSASDTEEWDTANSDAAEDVTVATEVVTDAAGIMTDAAEITFLSGKRRPASNFLSSRAIRIPRSVVAKYLQRTAGMTQGRKATKFPRKLATRSQRRVKPAAKNATAAKPAAAEEESSSDEDSSEEEEAPEAKKAAAKEESSSDDDSSDEEEEKLATKPVAKPAAAKEESSDDSDLDSEDEKPAPKVAKPASKPAKKEEISDDSSDASSEEEPASKKAKKPAPAEPMDEDDGMVVISNKTLDDLKTPTKGNDKTSGDKSLGEEGRKIFIHNVSEESTYEDFQEAVEKHGEVTDFFNPGRGFAFITCSTAEEAQACIKAMDNTEVGGRIIQMNIARPKAPGTGGRRQEAPEGCKLIVHGITQETDNYSLKTVFEAHGTITDAYNPRGGGDSPGGRGGRGGKAGGGGREEVEGAKLFEHNVSVVTAQDDLCNAFAERPAKRCRSYPVIKYPRSVVGKYLQRTARIIQFPRKLAIKPRKRAATRGPDEEVQNQSSDGGGGESNGHHGGVDAGGGGLGDTNKTEGGGGGEVFTVFDKVGKKKKTGDHRLALRYI